MNKILIIFLLICTIIILPANSQNEIQVGDYTSAQLAMNPGFAGSNGVFNVIALNRQQWVGFDGAPSTTVVGIDKEVKFCGNFHGLGAVVIHDQIGIFTTMYLNANYSYHIELEKGLLGLGLKVGLVNVKLSPSGLTTAVGGSNDDYHQESDEAIPTSDDSGVGLDVGFGAFYQTPRSYLSASVQHLNKPSPSFKEGCTVSIRSVMYLSGGRQFWLTDRKITIEPRLLFKTDFSAFQVEANAIATFNERVYAGLGYRYQEALLMQCGVSLKNGLRIGYGYDLNISEAHAYNSGTHEILVGYLFNMDFEKRTKRYKSVRFL